MLRETQFTTASDVWAMALTFIEILQGGAPPYKQLELIHVKYLLEDPCSLEEKLYAARFFLWDKNEWSDDMQKILLICLSNAKNRATAEQLSEMLENAGEYNIFKKVDNTIPLINNRTSLPNKHLVLIY